MTGLVETLLIVGVLLLGGVLLLNALLRRWVDTVATYAESIATLLDGNERALDALDPARRAEFVAQSAGVGTNAQALLAQLREPPPGALAQLWFGVTPSALRWQQAQQPIAQLYARAQALAEQIERAAPRSAPAAATQPMSAAATQPLPAAVGMLTPPASDNGSESLRRLLARAGAAMSELPTQLADRAAMRATLLATERQVDALPADDTQQRESLTQQLERLHAGAQRLGLDYTRLTSGLPLLRAVLEDKRAALGAAMHSDLPFAWDDTLGALDQLALEQARAAELPPSLTHDAIKARLDALRDLHGREQALGARIDHALAQRDALATLLRRPELAPDRPWLRSLLGFDRRVGTAETATLVADATPLVQQHDDLLANVAALREGQIADRYAEADALCQAVHALGAQARALAQGLGAQTVEP